MIYNISYPINIYNIVVSYTNLYYINLYYTNLYYIILYYTNLYYTNLFYTNLYHTAIGDPAYDRQEVPLKLMNVSSGSRKRVQSLNGVDTKNKTVTQLSDGSWEVFESSHIGLQRIARET